MAKKTQYVLQFNSKWVSRDSFPKELEQPPFQEFSDNPLELVGKAFHYLLENSCTGSIEVGYHKSINGDEIVILQLPTRRGEQKVDIGWSFFTVGKR